MFAGGRLVLIKGMPDRLLDRTRAPTMDERDHPGLAATSRVPFRTDN